MKGNDGSGNNSGRDIWETPKKLWDGLNNQYGFNFDCCANKENSKCENYSSEFQNIILSPDIVAWMNPPFSIALDMFEHFFKVINKGVAIYRCDNMETKVWHDIIFKNADWIAIPKGRIRYEGFEGNSSRFPSALIGKGLDVPNLKGWIILEVK